MYRFNYFVFVVLLIQTAYGQVIRSRSCSNTVAVPETFIAGPTAFTQVLPGPFLPNMVFPANLPCYENVVANPTVLSTQSVANDLANTMQLLTVSSLLSEKLPFNNGVPIFGNVVRGCGCGGPITIY